MLLLFLVSVNASFSRLLKALRAGPPHPGDPAAASSSLGTDEPLPVSMVTWITEHVCKFAFRKQTYGSNNTYGVQLHMKQLLLASLLCTLADFLFSMFIPGRP